MQARVILVDMDGVLSDFDAETQRRLAEQYPEIAQPNVRTNFYIAQDYPEHKEAVREIANEEGFFSALPPISNAIAGWQRLIDLGYRPRVCSSPVSENPHCEREKRAWLAKHLAPLFGTEVATDAVITKDKHLCEGLALIDDCPEVRNHEIAPWRHIIFDRPYNRDADGARLFGWMDEALPEVLKTIIGA